MVYTIILPEERFKKNDNGANKRNDKNVEKSQKTISYQINNNIYF